MKSRTAARRFPIYVVLIALLVASATLAQDSVVNRGVKKRMATMNSAKTATGILTNMMSGRVMFDASQARAARKILLRAVRDIPARFRRPHEDPLSHARPLIWMQWDDFRVRAKTARRAARDLNANSLNGLRKTLPGMIVACLACHKTFREPR